MTAQRLLPLARVPLYPLSRCSTQMYLPANAKPFSHHLLPSKSPSSSIPYFPILKSPLRHTFKPTAALDPDLQQTSLDSDLKQIALDQQEPRNGEGYWDEPRHLLLGRLVTIVNLPCFCANLVEILRGTIVLLEGQKTELFLVPWQGLLTGLFGLLALLSFLVKKKEEVLPGFVLFGIVIHYVMLAQFVMAGTIPVSHFAAISAIVVAALVFNYMAYLNKLSIEIVRLWDEVITFWGMSVFPMIIWSVLVQKCPDNIFPPPITLVISFITVVAARMHELPELFVKDVGVAFACLSTLMPCWNRMNFLGPLS